MNILEQIRTVRECKNLSQEQMAKKLNMTTGNYSKLERGESGMNVDKLAEIAKVFGMDLKTLLSVEGKMPVYQIPDNQSPISQSPPMFHSSYYYVAGDAEVEKLMSQIKHQNELLAEKQAQIHQQNEQIQTLKNQVAMAQEMIALLKLSQAK
ncbi:helix-turn-helix domain-containing protein [Conchiformibius kuhniae]|uniref:Helix-turn-helix domain-containing protein n=1 Tax=Conchiformibius kuhniae TaxID=211502 RepID=A0A8T9MVL4_9NEIS|nr:helix-turn-helix transcriptional regulator [Conchiformibius kuhniae]UOP04895.1 helix-turn-helix domain-containing protein [Conchiformibius kuhniae]